MDFETYLISKKIDSLAFREGEPEVWKVWCTEFEQMHPDSFTMQKLNLINPIRRKYPLATVAAKSAESSVIPSQHATLPNSEVKPADQSSLKPKPSIPKPVYKPKPKMS